MSADDLAFISSALLSLGAALGAVGITMGELFYTRAIADGKLETCEKDYIRATFWALRYGMVLVLISLIGLAGAQYLSIQAPQEVLTATYWFTLTAAIIVIFSGWSLAHNRIPWWLGSAIGFSGWWTIFSLTIWRDISMSYMALAFAFILGTAVVALLFHFIRTLVTRDLAQPHHHES